MNVKIATGGSRQKFIISNFKLYSSIYILLFFWGYYKLVTRYHTISVETFIALYFGFLLFSALFWFNKHKNYANGGVEFVGNKIIWTYKQKRKSFDVDSLQRIECSTIKEYKRFGLSYISLKFSSGSFRISSETPNYLQIKLNLIAFLKERSPNYERLVQRGNLQEIE
jgi:hypothetical protein